jgi:hypothetical protein
LSGALIGLPRELRTRDNMQAKYCENRKEQLCKRCL